MKNTLLVSALVVSSATALAQTEMSSNRPQVGSISVGLQADPINTLSTIFGGNQFGSSGIMLNGLDMRWYHSKNRAQNFSVNMDYFMNNYGPSTFFSDDDYTVSRVWSSFSVNLGYGYYWLYDFGQNWQLAYGPSVTVGVQNYTQNYEYSGTAQEFFTAGQYGTMQENYSDVTYTGSLRMNVELDYFFSNSLYIGAAWNLGADVGISPENSWNVTQIQSNGVFEDEYTSPSSTNISFFDGSNLLMRFGIVF